MERVKHTLTDVVSKITTRFPQSRQAAMFLNPIKVVDYLGKRNQKHYATIYLFTLWTIVASQALRLQAKAAANNKAKMEEDARIKAEKRVVAMAKRKKEYEENLRKQKEIDEMEGDII